jgi:hypothetical protein
MEGPVNTEVDLKPLLFLSLFFFSVAHARDYLPLHSHNDYLRATPFYEAVNNGFQSIEADVWLTFFDLKVAHVPWQNKGRFEDRYLVPLEKEVENNLYPVKRHLILWIDMKSILPLLRKRIARQLERHPLVLKEVEIVLTGLGYQKRHFVQEYPNLGVTHDEDKVTNQNLQDPSFTWYALSWKDQIKWDGKGNMPVLEKEKLRTLINTIHAFGKKLRFYDSPDTPEYWRALEYAGVDLIDTDHPAQLADFWKSSSFSL